MSKEKLIVASVLSTMLKFVAIEAMDPSQTLEEAVFSNQNLRQIELPKNLFDSNGKEEYAQSIKSFIRKLLKAVESENNTLEFIADNRATLQSRVIHFLISSGIMRQEDYASADFVTFTDADSEAHKAVFDPNSAKIFGGVQARRFRIEDY